VFINVHDLANDLVFRSTLSYEIGVKLWKERPDNPTAYQYFKYYPRQDVNDRGGPPGAASIHSDSPQSVNSS